MAISGNFTLYALSTSTYKDESINLPGVKNSMDRLRSILIKYCDRIFSIEDSILNDLEKMKVKMAVLFLRMTQKKERM